MWTEVARKMKNEGIPAIQSFSSSAPLTVSHVLRACDYILLRSDCSVSILICSLHAQAHTTRFQSAHSVQLWFFQFRARCWNSRWIVVQFEFNCYCHFFLTAQQIEQSVFWSIDFRMDSWMPRTTSAPAAAAKKNSAKTGNNLLLFGIVCEYV